MDKETGQKVLDLRERIVSRFDAGDWEEIGLRTGFDDIITGHDRLLRSLSWGDQDYSGNVLTVLRQMTQRDPSVLDQITTYLDGKYPGESHFISAKPAERKLTFAPHVFEVPPVLTVEQDLATVMMPFGSGSAGTHGAIKQACQDAALRCVRADDIWETATIIQDIFNLIAGLALEKVRGFVAERRASATSLLSESSSGQ